MSFSTETTRLCRYHGCWRDIVTDAPSPLIGHGVEPNLNLLCDKHASQLTGDLRWLERSLPDLCEYRDTGVPLPIQEMEYIPIR